MLNHQHLPDKKTYQESHILNLYQFKLHGEVHLLNEKERLH